jgi:hypothetical protein
MAYVYRHIRHDKNEPFYIGIGSSNNYKRAYSTDSRNKIWKSIISKTNYDVEILFYDITWDEACEKEIEFIDLYKRKCDNGILANLSKGGEGGATGFKRDINSVKIGALKRIGIKKSNEAKLKISKAIKGIKLTNEHKEKIRIRMIGNSYTLGIKLTDEHKQKISQSNKGKIKPITKCPYCGIVGGIPVLKRFHFDNCKNK